MKKKTVEITTDMKEGEKDFVERITYRLGRKPDVFIYKDAKPDDITEALVFIEVRLGEFMFLTQITEEEIKFSNFSFYQYYFHNLYHKFLYEFMRYYANKL